MFLLFLYLAESYQNHEAIKSLNDSEYYDEQPKSRGFVFIISIVFNGFGLALYIIFGIIYNPESEDCCAFCYMDYDDKENSFFSETLELFEQKKEMKEKEKNEIRKQNALDYLIETGALNRKLKFIIMVLH